MSDKISAFGDEDEDEYDASDTTTTFDILDESHNNSEIKLKPIRLNVLKHSQIWLFHSFTFALFHSAIVSWEVRGNSSMVLIAGSSRSEKSTQP